MQILPDGTLLVVSFWDVGGRYVSLYRNGDIVGQRPDTHMRAGYAVAANELFFFYTHSCGLENQPEAKAGEAMWEKPIFVFVEEDYKGKSLVNRLDDPLGSAE